MEYDPADILILVSGEILLCIRIVEIFQYVAIFQMDKVRVGIKGNLIIIAPNVWMLSLVLSKSNQTKEKGNITTQI